MKKFLIYLSGILLLVLALLFILDFFYTSIYNKANPRTKYQYLKSLKNSKVNYVFLGSSRVDNVIVPKLIENVTNLKTVNLGFQGSKMGDIYFVLELLHAYNIEYDTVFIQVDYNFNDNGCSINLPYQMAPFFKDNEITKNYLIDYVGKSSFYYFPFFRYCENESKIGVRELFANLINKKTSVRTTKGYSALQDLENHKESHRVLPEYIVNRNQYYEKIKQFGNDHNLNIVFFCAPFCKHTRNLNYIKRLKVKIPNLHDFSNVIQDDKMFVNCYHLNNDGAFYFSELFCTKILKNR